MFRYKAPDYWIWILAFGYFAFYIPYSGLTKALSLGILPGLDGPISGFVLFPATALTTTATLLVFLLLTGGWQQLHRRRLLGVMLPTVRSATFLSGLATAVIIGATTLNYTFVGISILLALLLMRGGVLLLAPLIDVMGKRRVSAYSWVALGLSFAAIGLALFEVDGYRMTWLAGLNIAAYLAGYAVRLNLMTSLSKSDQGSLNHRYFAEETFVAAVALTAVPALAALVGWGEIAYDLRTGFTSFLATSAAVPALLIGVFYGCLYQFGTAIYLDARENTFCVPLNRCSSLLSGLVASFSLTMVLGTRAPSNMQLAATGIILGALIFLMLATIRGSRSVRTRLVLFVCGGNTSRSPMAQAICNGIAQGQGLVIAERRGSRIMAQSAGLTAQPGQPLSGPAALALQRLGVEPHAHASRDVTADLVHQADVVFCMTESQRRELTNRFPEALAKVHRLDQESDVADPSGQDEEAFSTLGILLQRLVQQRLAQLLT
jgi:protein-tyrosine-phosphatase